MKQLTALSAIAMSIALLAACGGGSGGGSPTAMPVDPGGPDPAPVEPMPATPMVAGVITTTNDTAIDPTLAFRAVQAPAATGFGVTVTVPDSPVIVFNRHDGPRADLAPDDLDPMMRRAAHLWTRRLTDGGTWPVVAYLGGNPCHLPRAACAGTAGDDGNQPHAFIRLPDSFLERVGTSNGLTTRITFGTLGHETGHALGYRDVHTGHGHAACTDHTEQLMCPIGTAHSPIAPTEADFAGLREGRRMTSWTVSPASSATDHQDFGLWATVPEASGLNGFGITVRRTLSIDEGGSRFGPAAGAITDTITAAVEVRGTPTAGPENGLGTATWSGIFLGADTGRFEPVTGDAMLTADLEDLTAIDLALSALERTDSSGATHPLAAIAYELQRHDDAWIDADGRADARFYGASGDPAGAAAGIVSDDRHELMGAWGAIRE